MEALYDQELSSRLLVALRSVADNDFDNILATSTASDDFSVLHVITKNGYFLECPTGRNVPDNLFRSVRIESFPVDVISRMSTEGANLLSPSPGNWLTLVLPGHGVAAISLPLSANSPAKMKWLTPSGMDVGAVNPIKCTQLHPSLPNHVLVLWNTAQRHLCCYRYSSDEKLSKPIFTITLHKLLQSCKVSNCSSESAKFVDVCISGNLVLLALDCGEVLAVPCVYFLPMSEEACVPPVLLNGLLGVLAKFVVPNSSDSEITVVSPGYHQEITGTMLDCKLPGLSGIAGHVQSGLFIAWLLVDSLTNELRVCGFQSDSSGRIRTCKILHTVQLNVPVSKATLVADETPERMTVDTASGSQVVRIPKFLVYVNSSTVLHVIARPALAGVEVGTRSILQLPQSSQLRFVVPIYVPGCGNIVFAAVEKGGKFFATVRSISAASGLSSSRLSSRTYPSASVQPSSSRISESFAANAPDAKIIQKLMLQTKAEGGADGVNARRAAEDLLEHLKCLHEAYIAPCLSVGGAMRDALSALEDELKCLRDNVSGTYDTQNSHKQVSTTLVGRIKTLQSKHIDLQKRFSNVIEQVRQVAKVRHVGAAEMSLRKELAVLENNLNSYASLRLRELKKAVDAEYNLNASELLKALSALSGEDQQRIAADLQTQQQLLKQAVSIVRYSLKEAGLEEIAVDKEIGEVHPLLSAAMDRGANPVSRK